MTDLKQHAKWEEVVDKMDVEAFELDAISSKNLFYDQKRLLSELSIYKFIIKLIDSKQSVLGLGFEHGLGALIFDKECLAQFHIDNEKDQSIKSLWPHIKTSDYKDDNQMFDVLVVNALDHKKALDIIDNDSSWLNKIKKDGILIIATVGSYELNLAPHFHQNFNFFSINEVLQTGSHKSSDFEIFMGCLKK